MKQRKKKHIGIVYGPKDTGFTAHSIRGRIPSWLSTRDISWTGGMACRISARGFQRAVMVSYIARTQDVDKSAKHCQPVAITKFHARMTQPYVRSSEV